MKQKKSDEKIDEKSKNVLLLIDVISDFEFEDGEELFTYALPMAKRLAKFKKKAKKSNIPVIYINDNFGRWQEDFKKMVEYCLKSSVRGSEIVKLLKPDEDDYYILKPKHSAFYSTALDLLLKNFEAETLILTGVSTDIWVLFSANDAYMRDFRLYIPNDCVAAVKPEASRQTLKFVERFLKADTRASTEIDFDEILKENSG